MGMRVIPSNTDTDSLFLYKGQMVNILGLVSPSSLQPFSPAIIVKATIEDT